MDGGAADWETQRLDTRQQRTANQGKSHRSGITRVSGAKRGSPAIQQPLLTARTATLQPSDENAHITPEGGLHARIDSLFRFTIGTVGQYSSVMLISGKDKSSIRTPEK
uniref:Uncharacterized protein n=1 Tax=Coccidioides posadasii RMSCC 3488 TaxID=454284 RepID=A0A0J6II98_COCPO|nr:hypothetical protein CPAG_07890 [Coccidioides posadasii RMSCC 3488]